MTEAQTKETTMTTPHLLSRFVILFTLGLLIMGLFLVPATPAEAEPSVPCTPGYEGAYGFDGAQVYICKCVSVFWPYDACAWVPTGVYTSYSQALTYIGTAKCNLTTANIAKSGSILEASAIATGANKIGAGCEQATSTLRARMILQRFNGSSYVTCVDTGFVYGTTYNGLIVNRGYASAPCGAGNYRVYGGGWTLVSGVYQGGYRTTGAVYVS